MIRTIKLLLLLSITTVSCFAFAESIGLPNKAGEISIVSNDTGTTVIQMSGSTFNNITNVNSTLLESPARAVIDIEPSLNSLRGSQTIGLKDRRIFTTVRIGTSKEKTRFVLDFSDVGAKGLKISYEVQSSGIRVIITPGDSLDTTSTIAPSPTATKEATSIPTKSPFSTPTAVPTIPPATTPTNVPELIASPIPTPTFTMEPTITPSQTPIPTPEEVENGLKKVYFDPASDSLELLFVNPVNYQLTRTSSESYTLLLEKAQVLDSATMLDLFPPQGLLGFQAVTLEKTVNGIRIELYVEEDYQPRASWKKNILSIKAKSTVSQ